MYELTIVTGFASAHNLRDYKGSCERLHGHNWRVEVHLSSEELDALGMVKDFRAIKAEAEEVMERLDHKYINEIPPFDEINPSAENLARFIHGELSASVNDGKVRISLIRVWESDGAAAAYHE